MGRGSDSSILPAARWARPLRVDTVIPFALLSWTLSTDERSKETLLGSNGGGGSAMSLLVRLRRDV